MRGRNLWNPGSLQCPAHHKPYISRINHVANIGRPHYLFSSRVSPLSHKSPIFIRPLSSSQLCTSSFSFSITYLRTATMSQEAFDAAVAWVKDPAAVGEKPLKGVPTSRKLDLYKFYKQATEGDVKGSQPYMVQVTNRSKWDAWKTVEGTSAEDARQGYIDALAKQKEEFPREE